MLNWLRPECINPTLSAYNRIWGAFDFNCTPMAPPGENLWPTKSRKVQLMGTPRHRRMVHMPLHARVPSLPYIHTQEMFGADDIYSEKFPTMRKGEVHVVGRCNLKSSCRYWEIYWKADDDGPVTNNRKQKIISITEISGIFRRPEEIDAETYAPPRVEAEKTGYKLEIPIRSSRLNNNL